MTYLPSENPSLWIRLQNLLQFRTPVSASPPFLATVQVNAPDAYAEKQKFAVLNGSGNASFGNTGAPEKNLYITDVMISLASVATSDTGQVVLNAVINGQSVPIATCAVNGTATASGNGNNTTNFRVPVKVDLIANNISLTNSFNIDYVEVIVKGYQM